MTAGSSTARSAGSLNSVGSSDRSNGGGAGAPERPRGGRRLGRRVRDERHDAPGQLRRHADPQVEAERPGEPLGDQLADGQPGDAPHERVGERPYVIAW